MSKPAAPSDVSVLHVIDHMGLGGAQRAVGDQLKHRPNDRVFILNGKKKNLSTGLGFHKPLHNGAKSIWEFPLLLPALLACLEKNQFQILHCHLRFSWFFGLLVKLFSKKQITVVFHERGWILNGGPLYKWLVNACAQRGVIVAISENIAHHLAKTGILPSKIQIIYNGLETSNFFQDRSMGFEFRKKHQIPEQAHLIGFAGRLEMYKGWMDYVDAISFLAREGHNVYGVIAGSGPDFGQVVRYIEQCNLTGRIMIIGHIGDMVDYYNALDVFVFPSHFEPLGRVQLEAQACGVPVIASDIPGTVETISRENAILVPSRAPMEIARAIELIRTDSELNRRLREAGEENIHKFEYGLHLQEINSFYNKVVSQEDRNG